MVDDLLNGTSLRDQDRSGVQYSTATEMEQRQDPEHTKSDLYFSSHLPLPRHKYSNILP